VLGVPRFEPKICCFLSKTLILDIFFSIYDNFSFIV